MKAVVVTIPGIKLKTPGNGREPWYVAAKRAKEQRGAARLACLTLGREVKDTLLALPALRIRFVRVGGRKMDPTNLVGACKHVQDGLCDWLGVDDSSDWYRWEWPVQESGSDYAVRIELGA